MKYELNMAEDAYIVSDNDGREVARFDYETDAARYCKEHAADNGPHDILGICQRIKALDDERWELNRRLIQQTGQSFEEVMAGMTRLLAPAGVATATRPSRK